MREELGDDEGKAAAAAHRAALLDGMKRVRNELDNFKPDFLVIWGDDQHENFTEDIIPAFCILAYDKIEAQPWRLRAPGMPGSANVWKEGLDHVYSLKSHRAGALHPDCSPNLRYRLLLRPLHLHGIGHAFPLRISTMTARVLIVARLYYGKLLRPKVITKAELLNLVKCRRLNSWTRHHRRRLVA
jgi:hypothetical protein